MAAPQARALAAATLVAACSANIPGDPDRPAPVPSPVTTFMRAVPSTKLDFLFVVDSGESMLDEQAALAAAFPRLLETLSLLPNGLPDLHLGVISADVGTGPFEEGGCVASGDDGRLRRGLDDTCVVTADRYLSDRFDGGARARNYDGQLADAFGCMAALGGGGCGFSQPLESLRRALDQPDNAGFLRDDAALAVVVVSDRDDCSARDAAVFDPAEDTPAQLGPYDGFRCFTHGVVCEPDDPRGTPDDGTEVTFANCEPRSDSRYLAAPAEFLEVLREHKPDPADLTLSLLAGALAPVRVHKVADQPDAPVEPRLIPSCTSLLGQTTPPVRLASLIDEMGTQGGRGESCDGNYDAGFRAIGKLAGRSLYNLCAMGDLVDHNAGLAGVQPQCLVERLVDAGQASEERSWLPSCERGGSPCFAMVSDAVNCGDTPSRLRFEVLGDPPAVGVTYALTCEGVGD